MNEAEKIAAHCLPHIKQALLAAAETKTGEWWTPYAIYRADLVQQGVITPLGLEVRRILQEQSNG